MPSGGHHLADVVHQALRREARFGGARRDALRIPSRNGNKRLGVGDAALDAVREQLERGPMSPMTSAWGK